MPTRIELIRDAIVADTATYGPLSDTAPGAKTDQEIADLFNAAGPNAPNLDLFDVDADEYQSLIGLGDWPNPTLKPSEESWLRTALGLGRIRITAQTKQATSSIFAGTQTLTRIQARFARPKTRAEVIGQGLESEPVSMVEVHRARRL